MNPITAPFDPTQLWTLQTLYQVMVGSAVVATVINVTWFIMSSSVRAAVRLTRRRTENHTAILGRTLTPEEYKNVMEAITGFYCLVVRYGTDDYLQKLASDEERHEGRLRLKILPVQVKFDERGNAAFALRLPVHKRLGTQFKCFAMVKHVKDVNTVITMLNGCAHVKDVKQSDSQHKNRIYFSLDQFFMITTVDGIKNNFVFPK